MDSWGCFRNSSVRKQQTWSIMEIKSDADMRTPGLSVSVVIRDNLAPNDALRTDPGPKWARSCSNVIGQARYAKGSRPKIKKNRRCRSIRRDAAFLDADWASNLGDLMWTHMCSDGPSSKGQPPSSTCHILIPRRFLLHLLLGGCCHWFFFY